MFFHSIWIFAASVLVQTYGFRLATKLDNRIIGGEPAEINDFPHQLSLQLFDTPYCGASLIKADVGLTAAHCNNFEGSAFTVRGGSNFANSGGEVVEVSEIISHPNYNKATGDYDAAIVKFVKQLTLGSAIPLQPKNEDVADGAIAVVSGWGATQLQGPNSEQLLKISVAHINHVECAQSYLDLGEVTDRMTCYAAPGKDVCRTDSGAPLILGGKQIGLASWGYSCADPRYPRVYTRISNSDIQDYIAQYLN